MILENTDFVVGLAFVAFIAVLWRFGVPEMVTKALDARAERIKEELAEARGIRDEAQRKLAEAERKRAQVETEMQDIVAHARREAEEAAEAAKREVEVSIARRLRAAEEKIASAEAAAVREVRNEAIRVAVDAAAEAISAGLDKANRDRLIDEGTRAAADRLH